MASELTAQQIQEFRQSFDIIDRDGDGYINADDLLQLFQALGANLSRTDVEGLIKENDVDGTERIDFPGFLAIMTRETKQADIDDELREAFRTMDKDQDGFITASELSNLLQSIGIPLSGDVVRRMIAEADKNRDQKLDFAEFRNIALSN